MFTLGSVIDFQSFHWFREIKSVILHQNFTYGYSNDFILIYTVNIVSKNSIFYILEILKTQQCEKIEYENVTIYRLAFIYSKGKLQATFLGNLGIIQGQHWRPPKRQYSEGPFISPNPHHPGMQRHQPLHQSSNSHQAHKP